jgi:hypothetical protein
MGQLFTKMFWRDAIERALSTAAQSVIAVTGLEVVDIISAPLNLKTLGSAAIVGFVLTIIKAVAASYIGDPDSASFVE